MFQDGKESQTLARDDILDALVAAVTAKLGCQNNDYELRTLPS